MVKRYLLLRCCRYQQPAPQFPTYAQPAAAPQQGQQQQPPGGYQVFTPQVNNKKWPESPRIMVQCSLAPPNGPNHLGLRLHALLHQKMARITSDYRARCAHMTQHGPNHLGLRTSQAAAPAGAGWAAGGPVTVAAGESSVILTAPPCLSPWKHLLKVKGG